MKPERSTTFCTMMTKADVSVSKVTPNKIWIFFLLEL